jgi:glycosyltransferase 2 family protein
LGYPEPTLIPSDTPAPRPNSYRVAKRITGYIIALGCLLWVFRDVHLRPLFGAMKIARWEFVALAIVLDILTYLFQGVRWHILLLPVGNLGARRATQGVYAGLFVNELAPLRLGEILRAILVSRWLSVSLATVLPSIVVERLLDALWLVIGLGLAILIVPVPQSLVAASEILGVMVLGVAVLFLWLTLGDRLQCEHNERYSRSCLPHKILGSFWRFSQGMRDIGFSGELFLAFLLSIAMLVLQVVVLWFMLHACRIHLSVMTAAIVFLILRLGTTIPNAPANVGTFQLFTVLGLTFFGVNKTAATAFSIVYFGVLTVPLWTLGLLAIASSGLNLRARIRSRAFLKVVLI